jgi:hypothetical protein
MNNWFNNIKLDMIDRLGDMEGREICLCDIGFELTYSVNTTGSWYCSTFKARQEIGEHWQEFGLIAEYMRDNWEDTTNPLLDSELFHVRAMICLYERLFDHAVRNRDDWNDEITIDSDFIESVKSEMPDIVFDDLF